MESIRNTIRQRWSDGASRVVGEQCGGKARWVVAFKCKTVLGNDTGGVVGILVGRRLWEIVNEKY